MRLMSCATPILPSGPVGHVPEMPGHVPEIAGHDPETAGHVRPKYARFITLANNADVDADVLSVTLQVNRAALHIDERRTFFRAAYYQLSDDPRGAANIQNLRPI